MKVEKDVKQDQIVETALRRFSHFGIAKTTLTEVADDLSVSKQVLSYYFPDKQSLVNAVIDKLKADYIQQLKAEMEASCTVEEGLLKLTEVKADFFEKYFMLVIGIDHLELARNQDAVAWRQRFARKELALVVSLFENGMKTGELRPLDARKTGDLLLETLYAFSRCVKDRGALPDADAFRDVLTKQREVIKLFYQGLKAEKWAN
jgi:TetR/AcrR family transcriptional repressor of mexJK operon